MNPFTVLGIKTNASVEEAQKAYRKLSMQHHPDRGGNEEQFKIVKAAWEKIEGGYRDIPTRKSNPGSWQKPKDPGDTWRDADAGSIFEEMKAANRAAPNYNRGPPNYNDKTSDELVATTTLREAFTGFSMVIPRQHVGGLVTQSTVHIPPGTPDGYRGKYQVSDGRFVHITTRIDSGKFTVRSFNDQNNLFSAGLQIGDIEIEVPINALDIITGCWFNTHDFLGEHLNVRVPAGFNPLHRLKIAGKGYYGWDPLLGSPLRRRMDMYVRLQVQFTPLKDIDHKKLVDLHNTLQTMVPQNDST
jgi:DnaJ-class molecular chaperone